MPAGKPLTVKVQHLLCSPAAVGVQLWAACIHGCAEDMQSWASVLSLRLVHQKGHAVAQAHSAEMLH